MVRPWHVLVLAGMLGLTYAFEIPARQALLADLAGEDMPNAIALNSSIVNAARVAGPALAGVVVASVGEGWAFALNALIERDRVQLLGSEPETVLTPSQSGIGQRILRCPTCRIAVWSHYGQGALSDAVRFVRVGTLDNPERATMGETLALEAFKRLDPDGNGVISLAEFKQGKKLGMHHGRHVGRGMRGGHPKVR